MRFLKGIIISTVMLGILLGFSLESFAVPNLQIYIPGATYEDETWVIEKDDFELWVIGANYTLEDVRFAAAVPDNQDGSIEVTWVDNSFPSLTLTESGGASSYTNYLNSMNSTNYVFVTSPELPYKEPFVSTLPSGEVFKDTDFYEYYIGQFVPTAFDADTNPVYDYTANDGDLFDPGATVDGEGIGTAIGNIKKFHIKVNGYMWTNFVAYGYYLQNNCGCGCDGEHYVFSPYSHDGAMVVPEPATLFLLGTGLIGLGAFGRKKFKKFKSLDI